MCDIEVLTVKMYIAHVDTDYKGGKLIYFAQTVSVKNEVAHKLLII